MTSTKNLKTLHDLQAEMIDLCSFLRLDRVPLHAMNADDLRLYFFLKSISCRVPYQNRSDKQLMAECIDRFLSHTAYLDLQSSPLTEMGSEALDLRLFVDMLPHLKSMLLWNSSQATIDAQEAYLRRVAKLYEATDEDEDEDDYSTAA